MIQKIDRAGMIGNTQGVQTSRKGPSGASFDTLLQKKVQETQQPIHFSKHAMARVEQRGIQLTPTLMDKLADSVEKAQEKGATNILAVDADQAFIINVPYGRVITTMTQEEMKENIFTNIDGAVLL